MRATVCENCNAEMHGVYCSNCGEKAGSNALVDSVLSSVSDYVTIAKSLPLVLRPTRLAAAVEEGKVGLRQGLKLYGAALAAVLAASLYLPMDSERVGVMGNWFYAPATTIVNALMFYPVHMFLGSESSFKSSHKPLAIWLHYMSVGAAATLALGFLMRYNGSTIERNQAISVMLATEVIASVALKRYYGDVTSTRKTFLVLFFCTFFLGQLLLLLLGTFVLAAVVLVRAAF